MIEDALVEAQVAFEQKIVGVTGLWRVGGLLAILPLW